MSNVSGLFKDLTTVKKARNGRLASGIREVRIRIIGKSRQVRQSLWRSGRTWMYHTYLDDFFLQKSSSKVFLIQY